MATDTKPRVTQPGELLSQWFTLGGMVTDPRISGRHLKAAWVIIDRHMRAKGNAQASVRFISRATGQSSVTIVKACTEMVDWGYMSARKGSGRRPTEYSPKWLIVSPVYNAKGDEISVSLMYNASVSPVYNANDGSVSPVHSESCLPDRLTSRVTESRRDLGAEPPGVGGDAPLPAAPRGKTGFEELWTIWPRKTKRVEARDAYAGLAPDDALHAQLIAAALRWAGHYKSTGTDARYQAQLASWLKGERWAEDLPVVFVDRKQSAAPVSPTKKPASPAPSKQMFQVGSTTDMPVGAHLVQVETCVSPEPYDPVGYVKITVRPEDSDNCWSHDMCTMHTKDEEWEEGRKCFSTFLDAIGDPNGDPIGRHVWAIVTQKAVEYRSA